MSALDAYLPLLVPLLTILSIAVGGGYFIKRGSIKPTLDVLQQAVNSYEQIHLLEERKAKLVDEQLVLVTAERDTARQGQRDAETARDAEKTRAERLNRMIADNVLERDAWTRERNAWALERNAWALERGVWAGEKLAMTARITDLETQVRAIDRTTP